MSLEIILSKSPQNQVAKNNNLNQSSLFQMICNQRLLLTQNQLFVFFAITIFGSVLTSITCFVQIIPYFHSVSKLAWVLSLNTLFMAVYATFCGFLLRRIGVKRLFIITQMIGAIGVGILIFAFFNKSFALIILAIAFTGFTASNIQSLMTITLKQISYDEVTFRKASGSREMLFGFLRLAGGLLAPALLIFLNVYYVFCVDLLTYIISIIFLTKLVFPTLPMQKESNSKTFQNLLTPESVRFFVFTSAAMLLIGLIPMLASAGHFSVTEPLPIYLRQSIWSIDGLTMMLGSMFYVVFKNFKYNKIILLLLTANALYLAIVTPQNATYTIIPVLIVMSFVLYLAFAKFRDDYVLSANQNLQLVVSYSAISTMQRNIMCFISPLILAFLLTHYNWHIFVMIILGIQVGVLSIYGMRRMIQPAIKAKLH